MNYKLKIGISLLLMLLLCGCGALNSSNLQGNKFGFGSNVTEIKTIQAKREKLGTVYVQGKVERKVPLLQRQAYLINDSTGKIWIVTNQHNVKEGESFVMRGKILYQSIPIANQEFGEVYLEEE
ncbi:hypothetical protein [Nostoc sp. CMAA1605]|uniref:hypothetical protein n=1 Tax=Nostoc sp. CMAA1605 TaxID=2055159 RepID=UPI001F1F615B|nr:hypothetical protein [Nostoc sp. CMAA1605]MCF4968321.1 hypothetical protein [Nostoc sp. CMAA1605]